VLGRIGLASCCPGACLKREKKNMRLLIIILFFVSFGGHAQTTSEKKKLLVGKWKETLRDTSLKGKKPDLYCSTNYYCKVHEFTADQKYLLTNNGEPIKFDNGSWKFKGDSIIRSNSRGRIGYKIEKLTNDELILSVWEGGSKKNKWDKPGYIFFKKQT
jgi:hypothetical protein